METCNTCGSILPAVVFVPVPGTDFQRMVQFDGRNCPDPYHATNGVAVCAVCGDTGGCKVVRGVVRCTAHID